MRKVFYILLFLFLFVQNVYAQTETSYQPFRILQETPWTASTPGPYTTPAPVLMLWDANEERYYVNVQDIFAKTGFEGTLADTTKILVYEGSDYVPLSRMEALLGPRIKTDRGMLHILIYAPQETILRTPQMYHMEGPLLFGRKRRVVGNTQINYRLTRGKRYVGEPAIYNGSFSLRSNVLWGRILAEGTGRGTTQDDVEIDIRNASYLLDFPSSPFITKIQIGRIRNYNWPFYEKYDGIQIGNEPFSTRHLTATTAVQGVAEPDAIVAASIGGVLADRVRAGSDGRYTLNIPTYYGSSQVLIEIYPPDGVPRTFTKHIFIAEDIVPKGDLYYDIYAGRTEYMKDSLHVGGKLSYGLTSKISLNAAYVQNIYDERITFGSTQNIANIITTDFKVAFPFSVENKNLVDIENFSFAQASINVANRKIRFATSAEISEKETLLPYKQRVQSHIGFNVKRFNVFLNGIRVESFRGDKNINAFGSVSSNLFRRFTLVVSGGVGKRTSYDLDKHWKAALTKSLSVRRLHGRVGVQADGKMDNVDFAGGTFYTYYRNFSVGTRVGYNLVEQQPEVSLTVRLNTPFASLSNFMSIKEDQQYHRQSAYGMVELGRRMRLSRHNHVASGAVISAYVDENRNGKKDKDEQVITDLDINVLNARVRKQASGTRADYLVPHGEYQVIVNTTSLSDPNLHLSHESFSFIADPGATKRVRIPLHRNTIVNGTIENLPLSSPTQAKIVFYENDRMVLETPVSQAATFSALLPTGTYTVKIFDLVREMELQYTERVQVINVRNQSVVLTPTL